MGTGDRKILESLQASIHSSEQESLSPTRQRLRTEARGSALTSLSMLWHVHTCAHIHTNTTHMYTQLEVGEKVEGMEGEEVGTGINM